MFDKIITIFLNRYINQYIEPLESNKIEVFVWKGEGKVTNMVLKKDMISNLDIPFIVKFSHLGKLFLKTPWTFKGGL